MDAFELLLVFLEGGLDNSLEFFDLLRHLQLALLELLLRLLLGRQCNRGGLLAGFGYLDLFFHLFFSRLGPLLAKLDLVLHLSEGRGQVRNRLL